MARIWTDTLTATSYVPLSGREVEDAVGDLLDQLIDALGAVSFSAQPGTAVGTQLVARGFTGNQSLGCTVELLGTGLAAQEELHAVEQLPARVSALLGALAAGYTTALRCWILDQQEDIKRALLRAKYDADRQRQASQARLREVFDAAPLGIAISHPDGLIVDSNDTLTDFLGYPSGGLAGRTIHDLFPPDDAARLATAYQELVAGPQARFRARTTLLAAKGDTIWASIAVSVLRDTADDQVQHITMIEDISDVHLLEQRLRHQTLHDLLTGLPNQQYFWIELNSVLERCDRDATITLCKIDLDDFAVVNEGHGREAGNLLLGSVAGRLQALVAGERAMVARFGDDEFVLLIENSPTSPAPATLAAAILAELAEPVYFRDHGLTVSAGVGILCRPARGMTAVELVRATDATLHQAKRTGRGQWALYDAQADAEQQARYTLATSMPGAWENGQVTLAYQPLVRLGPPAADAGPIVAIQALLHWTHPERGVIAHEDCVELAEQTGLMLSIGPWLLRQACRQLRSWRDQLGAATPPIRVDLTTHLAQDPDLVAVLRSVLAEARLGPADVQLEIPVELVAGRHGDTEENLRTLADMGVWTVLTRYGQAVGNLAMLQHQPVREVHITPQLVHQTAQQGDSVVRQAVTTLVPLIRRSGIAVVVAGIDSAEQAQWWRAAGADSARGAAFEPPTGPDGIRDLLAR